MLHNSDYCGLLALSVKKYSKQKIHFIALGFDLNNDTDGI